METISSILAVLAGLILRLAIPIAGTLILVYLLRRLDAYWQAEAQQMPLIGANTECWKSRGCSDEQRNACAAASSPLPCWQVHRQPNGYLQEKCIACEVFRNAPIPALNIETRRM